MSRYSSGDKVYVYNRFLAKVVDPGGVFVEVEFLETHGTSGVWKGERALYFEHNLKPA